MEAGQQTENSIRDNETQMENNERASTSSTGVNTSTTCVAKKSECNNCLKLSEETKIFNKTMCKICRKSNKDFMPNMISYANISSNYSNVLKEAKMLFTKRTKTLYHWMNPSNTIMNLKGAVERAWEKLSTKEKEFYIAQVLAKYGFIENSVITNPFLNHASSAFLMDENARAIARHEEDNIAVSTLIQVEEIPQGSGDPQTSNVSKVTKKRRAGRPPGSKNKKKKVPKVQEQEFFQNDPELVQELRQFQMVMSVNDPNRR